MDMEYDNRTKSRNIFRYFGKLRIVQIIFILGSLFYIWPAAIVEIVLLMVTMSKTKLGIKIAIAGNVSMSVGFILLFIYYRFIKDKATQSAAPSFGDIYIHMDFVRIVLLIINVVIIALCIHGYSYARDNELLKKLEGYPYFDKEKKVLQKNIEQENIEVENISTDTNVDVKTERFESRNFYILGFNALKKTYNAFFKEKIMDGAGYYRVSSIIIIVINMLSCIISKNILPAINAYFELRIFLMFVESVKDRIAIGLIVRMIWLVSLLYSVDRGEFSIVLVIMNAIEIIINICIYKKFCKCQEKRDDL